jgi:hypothetical protein
MMGADWTDEARMLERHPATEDEMIAAFLRAEVDSHRWSDCVKKGLAAVGLDRSLIDQPDLTDSHQNGLRKQLLWYRGYEHRVGLFAGFPPDVTWRRVDLEASDLQSMRYINDTVTSAPNWNELSGGTRLVSEGARNLSQFASDQRFQHIVAMAQAIRDGKRFGPLIAAQHHSGHLILIEGHSRATAYAMERYAETVETFVGSSLSMWKWAFY